MTTPYLNAKRGQCIANIGKLKIIVMDFVVTIYGTTFLILWWLNRQYQLSGLIKDSA